MIIILFIMLYYSLLRVLLAALIFVKLMTLLTMLLHKPQEVNSDLDIGIKIDTS